MLVNYRLKAPLSCRSRRTRYGILGRLILYVSGHWLHSKRFFFLVISPNWWKRCRKIVHYPLRVSDYHSFFFCMPQKLDFTLMYLLMLVWSVGLHIWDGWSGPKKLLHIYSAAWQVWRWVNLETLEEVIPVVPPRFIVLVPLPFIWCLSVFLWCTISAWECLRKRILRI